MSLFELLACYGLTFGLMNKTSWIQNRVLFTRKLLECSYCTGFHTGWILYFAKKYPNINLDSLLIWAFAASAFSYIADTFTQYLEE